MVFGINRDGFSYDERSDGQLGEVFALLYEYVKGGFQRSAFGQDLVDIRKCAAKNISFRKHTEEVVFTINHHEIAHAGQGQELGGLVKARLVPNLSRPDGHDFPDLNFLYILHL